jgi:hypothetical protein
MAAADLAAAPTFEAPGSLALRCWSSVLVEVHVSNSTSPKMKSFSSAVNDDDERECAQTSLNVEPGACARVDRA